VALTLYAAVLTAYVLQVGVPFDRSLQALWLLAGMGAASVGRPVRAYVRMLRDWVPFLALLLAYDYTRGVSDSMGRPVLVGELVAAERVVALGSVPTVTLQERFHDPADVRWYDVVSSLVYASHFVVPWVLAAVLYVASRQLWVGFARRIVVLSAGGLLTYMLLPAAPPWFAARAGELDDVRRIATRGWSEVGLRSAGQLLEHAQADANLVAALPSLHAGTAMLIALWAWPWLRATAARLAVLAYAVVMGLTLVYGGEHYVVDILMGWAYAAGAVVACSAYERWRSARRTAVQAPDDGAGDLGVLRPHEHA
jgi:hypothetical protein